MAYSELREHDMFVEQEIAKFLDNTLYKRDDLIKKNFRVYDNETQYKGIDVNLSFPLLNLYNINVDEKAQADYIGNPLPTFVLELSSINKIGKFQDGWFIDENNLTQFYNLIWINKAKNNQITTANDIEEIEFCFVSKQKLRDYFAMQNYNIQTLKNKSNLIRKAGIFGPIDKQKDSPFYFFYSNKKDEKPIIIVVRKYIYKNFALLSGTITKTANSDLPFIYRFDQLPNYK